MARSGSAEGGVIPSLPTVGALRRLQSEGTKIGATRLISSARSLLVWQHVIRIHFTLKAVEDLERGYDSD